MDEVKNNESNGEWVLLDDKVESKSEEEQMPSSESSEGKASEVNTENIAYAGGILEPHIEELVSEDSDSYISDDSDKLLEAMSELVSVSKVRCYKHDRNDRLNFILNLILALVVSTAVGFGSGHFLGWSHRCQNDVQDEPVGMFDIVEKSENVLKGETLNKICLSDGRKFQIISSDTRFSESMSIGPTIVVNFTEETFLKEEYDILNNKQNLQPSELPSVVVSEIKQVINSSHDGAYNYRSKFSENIDSGEISNILISTNEGKNKDSVNVKSDDKKENFADFELLRELQFDVKHAFDKNNLIEHLRHDLSYIIHSLNTVAVVSISQSSDLESKSLKNELEFVNLTYSNFQTVIGEKLSELEKKMTISIPETSEKSHKKLLQKMVFCLINSVENFLKSSIKTFKKDLRNVQIEKFHRRTVKSIEDLNKKWEKFEKWWLILSENVNEQDFSNAKLHKRPTKHWKKKKFYSEKDMHKSKNFNRKNKQIQMKA